MTVADWDRVAQIRLKAAAIIPAYREEKHISDGVRRTRKQIDHVLVVDDGSSDKTAQCGREAGAEVIVHNQNRGKGEAIKAGLRHWLDRQFIHVIILDADGQHLPEEIERFIAAAASAAGPGLFLGDVTNNPSPWPFVRRRLNRCWSNRLNSMCSQE